MYGFHFTSSVEDLLEAEEAERASSIRRPFHWLIVILGIGWLIAGVRVSAQDVTLLSVVWVCLGLGVLYYFVAKPIYIRRRIKSSNAAEQDLVLEFTEDRLRLDISGVGEFTRGWDELIGVTNPDKGILFYFNDGVKNWLPKRVFSSTLEQTNFLEFIKRREVSRL